MKAGDRVVVLKGHKSIVGRVGEVAEHRDGFLCIRFHHTDARGDPIAGALVPEDQVEKG